MHYNLIITTKNKSSGYNTILTMKCVLTAAQDLEKRQRMTEHDIAARLFALEFAVNNHSEIPMRVHIEQID